MGHHFRDIGSRRRLFGLALVAVLLTACGGTGTPTPAGQVNNPAAGGSSAITAEAGALKTVAVGSNVILDGTESASMSGPGLSYEWAFTYTPAASRAALANADTATPSFVPDVPGTYLIQLVVRHSGQASMRDLVTVRAGTAGTAAASARFDHTGITQACVSCHDGSSATGQPAGHIPASDRCDACHATTAWTPVLMVDHNEVLGSCSSCHNGVLAAGKPADHPVTNQECNACHASSSWAQIRTATTGSSAGAADPGALDDDADTAPPADPTAPPADPTAPPADPTAPPADPAAGDDDDEAAAPPDPNAPPEPVQPANHDTLTSGCFGCHNNTLVEGKPADHIPAPDTCETCHNPLDWEPATPVDPGAPPVDPGLPPTTPGTPPTTTPPTNPIVQPANHDTLTSGCFGCHNNTLATGKPADHIPSPDTCETCHNPLAWTPATPNPGAPGGGAPGTPGTPPADGTPTPPDTGTPGTPPGGTPTPPNGGTPVSPPGGTPPDAGTPGTPPAGGPPTPPAGGATPFVHTPIPPGTLCGSCHNNTIATGKSDTHITTALDCGTCHSTTAWTPLALGNPISNPSNITLGPGFDHTGVSASQCAGCHNGTAATGRPADHISTTSRCASCHTTTRWTPVAFVDHNQVAGNCSSCHDGVTAVGKGPNHPPTNAECNQCHFAAEWVPLRE